METRIINKSHSLKNVPQVVTCFLTFTTDGIFKEFCCYGRSYLIEGSRSCKHFEDKNPVYDDEDGILRF